jgi:conserved oligomeric Golgi complex subunit 4
MTSLDSQHIQRLTNLNDINRLLNDTIAKERTIDSDLDRLLSHRTHIERGILVLGSSTQEVRHTQFRGGASFLP